MLASLLFPLFTVEIRLKQQLSISWNWFVLFHFCLSVVLFVIVFNQEINYYLCSDNLVPFYLLNHLELRAEGKTKCREKADQSGSTCLTLRHWQPEHPRSHPEPFLLQAEQPQLSQSFLIAEMLQLSDHSCGLPLDLPQQLHVFPVLRAPEMDTGLQVGSHQSRVEGKNQPPRPAGHSSFVGAQNTVGLLSCKHMFSGHVQLFIHQYCQVLLGSTALNPFIPLSVFILGISPDQVQDLALGFPELHEICMGTPFKPIKVSPNGTPSSSKPTTPPCLVSSSNLLRVHSVPLSVLLIRH